MLSIFWFNDVIRFLLFSNMLLNNNIDYVNIKKRTLKKIYFYMSNGTLSISSFKSCQRFSHDSSHDLQILFEVLLCLFAPHLVLIELSFLRIRPYWPSLLLEELTRSYNGMQGKRTRIPFDLIAQWRFSSRQ